MIGNDARGALHEIPVSEMTAFRVGSAQDEVRGTGCTAVICEAGAVAGASVRGGSPASRETDLLRPENTVQRIHCVMLSGGSAFGLASADGAMSFLAERGAGFATQWGPVPIVCGASLFDLCAGDPTARPDAAMGRAACDDAYADGEPRQGNVGAGTGATVGNKLGSDRAMKSGLGIYAVRVGEVQCAAVVAVNALGDVVDIDTRRPIAGLLTLDRREIYGTVRAMYDRIGTTPDLWGGGNTTIGCVITNARLSKAQACRLSAVAHNGYAMTISPSHTSVDGDAVFAMASCEVDADADAVGALAVECVGRAVNAAVLSATSAYGFVAARDL